jgi:predicted N-acyltransferase
MSSPGEPVPEVIRIAVGDDDAWDALAGPDDFFLSASWTRSVEHMRPQAPVHLAAVDDQGRLQAVLPSYLIDVSASSPFIRPDLMVARLRQERVLPKAPPDLAALAGLLPCLHCGSRQVGDSRMLLAGGQPPNAKAALVASLVQAAVEAARDRGAASVSFPYVDEARTLLRATLRDAGFAEFCSGWRCVFDVPPAFADYLHQLSASRRSQVRREQRRLAESGVRFTASRLTAASASRLAPLEAQLVARHGGARTADELAAMLRALGEQMAERTVLFEAWAGAVLVGFTVFLRWQDRLHLANVGLDETWRTSLPLYFGLAFYEPIAFAVDLGVRLVDYGMGSQWAKVSRGCRPVQQFGYLRALDPARQAAVLSLTTPLREPVPPDRVPS